MRKIPGIFTDIDGVLVRGKKAIPRSDIAFKFLRQSLNKIDPQKYGTINNKIPFIGLTNGGGKLENHKANEINHILQVAEDDFKWQEKNIVLNFSPLRSILKDYKDRIVLVTGVGNVHLIASDCGLQKFITVDEYCALFPYLVPISKRNSEDHDKTKVLIQERFGIYGDDFFNNPFKVDAIFVLHDVIKWEENIQVFCDLLGSHNGHIPKLYPHQVIKSHIPLWCVNDDFVYADEFHLPRQAFGAFTIAFKAVFKRLYGNEPNINLCGKPQKITFEYASIFSNFEVLILLIRITCHKIN